jgi:hypothetical protein
MNFFKGWSRSARLGMAVLVLALLLIVLDLLVLQKRKRQGASSGPYVITPPGASAETQASVQDHVARNGGTHIPMDGWTGSALLELMLDALPAFEDGAVVMAVGPGGSLSDLALPTGGEIVVRASPQGMPGMIAVRNSPAAREAISYMWSTCQANGYDETAAIAEYMRDLQAQKISRGLPIYMDSMHAPAPEGLPDVERIRVDPSHDARAEIETLQQMAVVDAAWRGQREDLIGAYRDARAGNRSRGGEAATSTS